MPQLLRKHHLSANPFKLQTSGGSVGKLAYLFVLCNFLKALLIRPKDEHNIKVREKYSTFHRGKGMEQ